MNHMHHMNHNHRYAFPFLIERRPQLLAQTKSNNYLLNVMCGMESHAQVPNPFSPSGIAQNASCGTRLRTHEESIFNTIVDVFVLKYCKKILQKDIADIPYSRLPFV